MTIVWFNGNIVAPDALLISAANRGMLLGDGVFETLKVTAGHIMFYTEHICRLGKSAHELALPIDRSEIERGVAAVLTEAENPTGGLRITVLRGDGPRGLGPIPLEKQRPDVLVSFFPAPDTESPKKAGAGPDRLAVASFRRSADAPSVRMKTLCYADQLFARAEAERDGAADAIFLNTEGDVTGTTMANLFVERDGGLVTPPLSSGLLPGIVRAQLLKAASQAGVDIRVERLKIEDLRGRWLHRTNSLIGTLPGWLADAGGEPKGQPSTALARLYQDAENRDKVE